MPTFVLLNTTTNLSICLINRARKNLKIC